MDPHKRSATIEIIDDRERILDRLATLRRKSKPRLCCSGPTFDGSADVAADADLVVNSTLIEIKNTRRRIYDFPRRTMHQLLGYVLMDYTDQHTIDQVALYLTRAGALISWPIEAYLALLGTRRRDLGELRAAFAQLLGYAGCPNKIQLHRFLDRPLPVPPAPS
jgi:hypothetical protein